MVSREELSLGPFERKLVNAQVVTQDTVEFLFRNVMVSLCSIRRDVSLALDDTLTSVTAIGLVFVTVQN